MSFLVLCLLQVAFDSALKKQAQAGWRSVKRRFSMPVRKFGRPVDARKVPLRRLSRVAMQSRIYECQKFAHFFFSSSMKTRGQNEPRLPTYQQAVAFETIVPPPSYRREAPPGHSPLNWQWPPTPSSRRAAEPVDHYELERWKVPGYSSWESGFTSLFHPFSHEHKNQAKANQIPVEDEIEP